MLLKKYIKEETMSPVKRSRSEREKDPDGSTSTIREVLVLPS
jgi:hypothetical protein